MSTAQSSFFISAVALNYKHTEIYIFCDMSRYHNILPKGHNEQYMIGYFCLTLISMTFFLFSSPFKRLNFFYDHGDRPLLIR